MSTSFPPGRLVHVADADAGVVGDGSPDQPHLLLATTSTPTEQFHVVDIRAPQAVVSSLVFGFTCHPHLTGKKINQPAKLGRFFEGDFRDNLFAHSDGGMGVKIWDMRNAKAAVTVQDYSIGRSKVLQCKWEGRTGLALLEAQSLTHVSLE